VLAPDWTLTRTTSLAVTELLVTVKVTSALPASDASSVVIAPDGAFTVTPVALLVSWVTAPPEV
jgi:hypothetical protein